MFFYTRHVIVLFILCVLGLSYYGGVAYDIREIVEGRLASVIFTTQQRALVSEKTASLLLSSPLTDLPIPVVGIAAHSITDTYGEPRSVERVHEGVDIFAPRGTFVRSVSEGVVVRKGFGALGGNYIFVLGPGGERYYYAHLDTIDPLIETGTIVDNSSVLGTVGTTGNAIGTPPHLHFGVYGKEGVKNPYRYFVE